MTLVVTRPINSCIENNVSQIKEYKGESLYVNIVCA